MVAIPKHVEVSGSTHIACDHVVLVEYNWTNAGDDGARIIQDQQENLPRLPGVPLIITDQALA